MNILLGITAGIAAYKTPQLVRLLTKKGHTVRVIMTERAQDFVTPLTLSTLSKQPVLTDFQSADHQWNSHVEAALWAEALLIAPATANTMAKMANGICDNLLLATYSPCNGSGYVRSPYGTAEYKAVGELWELYHPCGLW